MIDTIIVEDEPRAMHLLERYISSYCPELNIVGKATDANTAFEIIAQKRPKLLFLDIEISNEDSPETSFDLLARLPKYKYEVIFVTAFNQYAIQAIKYHALDYLLKPVSIEELENAVKVANERLAENEENDQLADLIKKIQNPQNENSRLWIPMSDGLQAIDINNIIRFEAAGRYTYIHIDQQKKILSTRNLKEYINLLGNQKSYVHVHRSHYINSKFISKYVSKDGGYILMSDQSQIPISRRKKQEFLDKIITF